MNATPVQSVRTRKRELPPNARRTAGEEHYSGYVIVRLRSGLPSTSDATLFDAAKRLQLNGLAGLLQAFEYRQIQFGGLVQFNMLDTRQCRDNQA